MGEKSTMSELGKAYVQIIPSAKGISGSISSALGGEATSAGKSAGLNIAGAIKGAIAAAGIGTAIKSALEAGGNLQQSFGGLDTLYGDAANAAKAYASEAAKAGISANSYAEQAVSFGASLKQAFEGDTTKAVEAANTAILDMADNAAKMGTPIENIQTAYQGFAKQNYTMLDNLKIGYGGTKSEMQRLLADATKLSGVEYNMDNLGDVYAAIHVIQEDLGLTGVAAAEASETFTGSLGAMKAAGENLLANIALGEDIRPALNALSQTVQSFLFNNLFPMLGNILESLPDLISGLGSMIIGSLNQISANSDELVQTGISIVTSLVSAIVEAAPYLVEAAWNLAASLGRALIETDWIAVGTDLMNTLKDSIDLAAGEILGMDSATVDGFLGGITQALPEVLNTGVELITSLANGILENIPQLITTAYELATQFVSFILTNAPTLLEAGANLLLNLVNGIVNNLPQIATAAIQAIAKFAATILTQLPTILQKGIEIVGKLAVGLIQAIPKVVAAVPQIIASIRDSFGAYDWPSIGMNLLEGIKNGILGAVSSVVQAAREAASAIWDTVKSFFDIGSPSKLMAYAGQMIDEGLAGGIDKNSGLVEDAMGALNQNTVAQLETEMNVNPMAQRGSDSRLENLYALLDAYLPQLADGMNIGISLEGDAQGLFNMVRGQNKIYKRMNGQSAF